MSSRGLGLFNDDRKTSVLGVPPPAAVLYGEGAGETGRWQGFIKKFKVGLKFGRGIENFQEELFFKMYRKNLWEIFYSLVSG